MLANRLYWGPNTFFDQGRGQPSRHVIRYSPRDYGQPPSPLSASMPSGGTTPNRQRAAKRGIR